MRTEQHKEKIINAAKSSVFIIISALIGMGHSGFGRINGDDNVYLDYYYSIAGKFYSPEHVAIVMIDDDSVKHFRDIPTMLWGVQYAKVIRDLNDIGTKSIALDILLPTTLSSILSHMQNSRNGPEPVNDNDIIFLNALSTYNVVLAYEVGKSEQTTSVVTPSPGYISALPDNTARIGFSNFMFDNDGVVRKHISSIKLETDKHARQFGTSDHTIFSLAMSTILATPKDKYQHHNDNTHPKYINYSGPPGTVPRVSFAHFFSPTGISEEEKKLLKDKYILIGCNAAVIGDRQRTPYSRALFGLNTLDMSSVEIHANIIETILRNKELKVAPFPLTAMLWAAFLMINILFDAKFNKIKKLGVINLSLVSLLSLAGYIIFLQGYILPQSGIIKTVAIYFVTVSSFEYLKEFLEKFKTQSQS